MISKDFKGLSLPPHQGTGCSKFCDLIPLLTQEMEMSIMWPLLFILNVYSDSDHHSGLMFTFIADDDDMTDLAEAIMEDCDGEVSERILSC